MIDLLYQHCDQPTCSAGFEGEKRKNMKRQIMIRKKEGRNIMKRIVKPDCCCNDFEQPSCCKVFQCLFISPCLCCISRICSVQVCFGFLSFLSTGFLGLSVLLVFYFYSMDNVNTVFAKNQDILVAYTQDFTSTWLGQGEKVLDVAEEWLNHKSSIGEVDASFNWKTEIGQRSIERLAIYFHTLAKTLNRLEFLGFGGKGGNLIGANTKVQFWTNESSRAQPCCWYSWGDLMVGINPENKTLPDSGFARPILPDYTFGEYERVGIPTDFRLLQWYKDATKIENGTQIVWTNLLTALNYLSSSVSRAYYDPNGEFQGVIVTWFNLPDFDDFLESLDLSPGILFMIDQGDGLLLASSSSTELYVIDEVTGMKTRTLAEESTDILVRDATLYILEIYDQIDLVEKLELGTFYSEGEAWLISAYSVANPGGFSILNVHCVRDVDVFGRVYEGNLISIVICICCVLFFSALSSCLICCVLRPLHGLSRQMKKLETLNLERIKIRYSLFHEIRMLQVRFRTAVMLIKRFRAFLPSYVLDEPLKERKRLSYSRPEMGHSFSSSSSSNKSQDSDFNTDSTPSGHSTASSEDMKSLSTFVEDRKNRFCLGISPRMLVCLYISILNWSVLYQSGGRIQSHESSYVSQFSKFLDYVMSVCRRFGQVQCFGVDRIIIYYSRSNVHQAIRNAETISANRKRGKIRYLMAISMDATLHGTLGSEIYKTNCLFNGAIEKSKFIIQSAIRLYQNRNSDLAPTTSLESFIPISQLEIILLDDSVAHETRHLESRKPVLLYNVFLPSFSYSDLSGVSGRGSEYVLVWRLIDQKCSEPAKTEEWMYELSKKEVVSKLRSVEKGTQKLLMDDLFSAKKLLKKYYEETSLNRRLSVFTEEVGEEDSEEDDEGVVVENKEKKFFGEGITPGFLLRVIRKLEAGEWEGSFQRFLSGNVNRLRKRDSEVVDRSMMRLLVEKEEGEIIELIESEESETTTSGSDSPRSTCSSLDDD